MTQKIGEVKLDMSKGPLSITLKYNDWKANPLEWTESWLVQCYSKVGEFDTLDEAADELIAEFSLRLKEYVKRTKDEIERSKNNDPMYRINKLEESQTAIFKKLELIQILLDSYLQNPTHLPEQSKSST